MENLPLEIQLKILSFADLKSLTKLFQTNKYFNSFKDNRILCRNLCQLYQIPFKSIDYFKKQIIRNFNMKSKKFQYEFIHVGAIILSSVYYGKLYYCGLRNGVLVMIDTAKFIVIESMKWHSFGLSCIQCNSNYLCSGGWDGFINIQNHYNGEKSRLFVNYPVISLALSENVLAVGTEQDLKIYNCKTNNCLKTIGFDQLVTGIQFSAYGLYLASGTKIFHIDFSSFVIDVEHQVSDKEVTGILIMRHLYSIGEDGYLRVFKNGKTRKLEGMVGHSMIELDKKYFHHDGGRCISRLENTIITGGYDRKVHLWNEKFQINYSLDCVVGDVNTVCSDGLSILSGGGNFVF